jgi:hypothetical protein
MRVPSRFSLENHGRNADTAPALASRLVADGGIPLYAEADALHVATASVHGIDYSHPKLFSDGV